MLFAALAHPINVDPVSRTLRPVAPDGDAYFGLEPGTNGTAAACRRDLVATGTGYRWIRSSGRPALGLNTRGSGIERAVTIW